jgi:hypothetical protein
VVFLCVSYSAVFDVDDILFYYMIISDNKLEMAKLKLISLISLCDVMYLCDVLLLERFVTLPLWPE